MPIKIVRKGVTPPTPGLGLEGADSSTLLFVCEAWRVMKGSHLAGYLNGFQKVRPNDGLVEDLKFLQELAQVRDGV